MCGFSGFVSKEALFDAEKYGTVLQRMGEAIQYRGPDDAGIWMDNGRGVGMVHRRLSILDLSQAGHQPMMSSCERFVISFNGEIYNHLYLRKELEKDSDIGNWRGHSDTETLLMCLSVWGMRKTLLRLKGMFAFSLWDRQEGELSLVRDRLGEKPVYFGWQNGFFIFGSDLNALRQHPAFVGDIDRTALSLYLRAGAVPAPFSIYKSIHKLQPGHFLTLSVTDFKVSQSCYWDPYETAQSQLKNPFMGTPEDAVSVLENMLVESIKGQMLSDVPLGAMLSGGIDSSTIVALMQALSDRPIKTFTIGFNEYGFDEAIYAKDIAAHLGTEHTELYLTGQDALDVVTTIPDIYSEPFSDSSQIPTILVSRLARESVTVALSGDGGDELFGGYTRYLTSMKLWKLLKYQPLLMRKLLASTLLAVKPESWNSIFFLLRHVLPKWLSQANGGDKVHKGALLLDSSSPHDMYHRLICQWPGTESVVLGALRSSSHSQGVDESTILGGFVPWMMFQDMVDYLPNDILTKVDRAAMGVSLETRIPFLDHEIVSFALSLPEDYKIRAGKSKWPLRKILGKYVPTDLTDRPKMGFGIPMETWLRGPLLEFASDLLDRKRLERDGYFDSEAIGRKWEEHKSGKRNWHNQLWSILMFQLWLDRQAV